MRLRRAYKYILCALLTLSCAPVYAQSITENQPLRFGKVALTNNNAPRQIILNTAGGYTADPQYIIFDDPQLANITVSGHAPLSTLTVTVGTATLTGASTANFSVIDTFTNPATITTNPSGEATFDVGATLESDGSGVNHGDDTYDGDYTITVTP